LVRRSPRHERDRPQCYYRRERAQESGAWGEPSGESPRCAGGRRIVDKAERVWTRDRLRSDVLEILREKSRKLDSDFSGPLTEETRIVSDLDFESVVIVEFCMAIGKHLQRKLPFQNLVFQNGQFQDFSVGQLLTFLEDQLARDQLPSAS
jgi:acyl carrier protein